MSLQYDSSTGLFRHVPPCSNSARREWHAGSYNGEGRLTVWFGGRNCPAGRAAWELHYGSSPIGTIDHKDGDVTNNRINNLRDVTQGINNENIRKPRAHNVLGIQGVKRKGSRFLARISVGGTSVHIGSYKTSEEASAAYVEAKRRVHFGNTL